MSSGVELHLKEIAKNPENIQKLIYKIRLTKSKT